MQFVGPILLDEAKALPADLQAFLDQGVSGPHAAVYVSMGTLARLSDDEVQSMAAALSALPNPVLWKLDQAWLPGRVHPLLDVLRLHDALEGKGPTCLHGPHGHQVCCLHLQMAFVYGLPMAFAPAAPLIG